MIPSNLHFGNLGKWDIPHLGPPWLELFGPAGMQLIHEAEIPVIALRFIPKAEAAKVGLYHDEGWMTCEPGPLLRNPAGRVVRRLFHEEVSGRQ